MIVDSHAWIAYFQSESEEAVSIIDSSGKLKTPSIAIAEVTKKFLQVGKAGKLGEALSFIREKSAVVALEADQAELAGKISFEERLPLADAIIYSYASQEDQLLTGDPHFKGKKKVRYLDAGK